MNKYFTIKLKEEEYNEFINRINNIKESYNIKSLNEVIIFVIKNF